MIDLKDGMELTFIDDVDELEKQLKNVHAGYDHKAMAKVLAGKKCTYVKCFALSIKLQEISKEEDESLDAHDKPDMWCYSTESFKELKEEQ